MLKINRNGYNHSILVTIRAYRPNRNVAAKAVAARLTSKKIQSQNLGFLKHIAKERTDHESHQTPLDLPLINGKLKTLLLLIFKC